MLWIILSFIFIFISPQSNAKKEIHSLCYKFTGLTKAGQFPAFSAEAESDDKQIALYSNDKQAWVRHNLTVDDWNKAPAEPPETSENFLNYLYNLSKCTHQAECSEFHVLQRRTGCEVVKLDGRVTNLTAYDKYAYDGKDFTNYKYSQPRPWMDKVTETNPHLTNFIRNCMKWILTFNNTHKSRPEVYIFARVVPDDPSKLVLSCLATGFYPRDIEMNIRLDRTNLENQKSSGIRPNQDESFQIRSSVEMDRNNKGSYDCLVIHSSTEPISVEWDGKCFTKCEPDPGWPVLKIVAIAVVAVLFFIIVIVCCICFFIKRRRSYGL